MAHPNLTPASKTSKSILPPTGSVIDFSDGSNNSTNYPIGIYAKSGDLFDSNFVSGAAEQVAYVYKKLGGDVLDIELTTANVYSSYEEAVLEYSYQINLHQSKNVLSDVLGQTTGTFDHHGQVVSGDSVSGSNVNLKYPRVRFDYAKRLADGTAEYAGVGGHLTEYSASFAITGSQQEYDLQTIIKQNSDADHEPGSEESAAYAGLVTNDKIRITRVYYKTPHAMWRFFGYYGGINVIGNMMTYGQFTDDSTFEIIPAWQNKLQAMAYEDHIYTRISHYSYELHNNKLKLFPAPNPAIIKHFMVSFTIERDAWKEDPSNNRDIGTRGINNINSIPFDNLPYKNINAIGKHWIRRYSLALCKETLGQIRGKFGGAIPIPGDTVNLNSADLLSQAKEEKTALIEELKKILEDTTYLQLMKNDAEKMDASETINKRVPLPIFVG